MIQNQNERRNHDRPITAAQFDSAWKTLRTGVMDFPTEHPPLRSLTEVEAERIDDNSAASFKDDDK